MAKKSERSELLTPPQQQAHATNLSRQISEDITYKISTQGSFVLVKKDPSRKGKSQTRHVSRKVNPRAAKDKAALEAMLYGAEQWNKTPHLHEFRSRDKSKELTKKPFVAQKEVKR